MKIKLSEEILEAAKQENAIQAEIQKLSRHAFDISEKFWTTLREKYKGYDFTAAKVDYETEKLVLPFQAEEEPIK